MIRKRWIWSDEEKRLIPEEEYRRPARNDAHYVIPDEMDALRHPATGEMISSKSKFRQITRQNGCIEIGTEKIEDRRAKNLDFSGISNDIIKAMERG